MNVITTTRLTAGDWGINDWYRKHNGNEMTSHGLPHHGETVVYTRHSIKEPPKCPPRQAHCSCGGVLIVEDEE